VLQCNGKVLFYIGGENMLEWTKPEVKELSVNSEKVLTIESSLYASGCHHGMYGKD